MKFTFIFIKLFIKNLNLHINKLRALDYFKLSQKHEAENILKLKIQYEFHTRYLETLILFTFKEDF